MADNGRNEGSYMCWDCGYTGRWAGWYDPGTGKYSMTCPVCGREEKVPTDLLDLSR